MHLRIKKYIWSIIIWCFYYTFYYANNLYLCHKTYYYLFCLLFDPKGVYARLRGQN